MLKKLMIVSWGPIVVFALLLTMNPHVDAQVISYSLNKMVELIEEDDVSLYGYDDLYHKLDQYLNENKSDIKDRKKLLDALEIYARTHNNVPRSESNANALRSVNKARALLAKHNDQPDASGRWDFAYPISVYAKDNQRILKEIKKLDQQVNQSRLTASQAFHVLELQQQFQDNEARIAEIQQVVLTTQWHANLEPKSRKALKEVAYDAARIFENHLKLANAVGVESIKNVSDQTTDLVKEHEKLNRKITDTYEDQLESAFVQITGELRRAQVRKDINGDGQIDMFYIYHLPSGQAEMVTDAFEATVINPVHNAVSSNPGKSGYQQHAAGLHRLIKAKYPEMLITLEDKDQAVADTRELLIALGKTSSQSMKFDDALAYFYAAKKLEKPGIETATQNAGRTLLSIFNSDVQTIDALIKQTKDKREHFPTIPGSEADTQLDSGTYETKPQSSLPTVIDDQAIQPVTTRKKLEVNKPVQSNNEPVSLQMRIRKLADARGISPKRICYVGDGFLFSTEEKYLGLEDYENQVKKKYGDDVQIADWIMLKRLFNKNRQQLISTLDAIKLAKGEGNSMLIFNHGDPKRSRSRAYYITRFEQRIPGHYLVHDRIHSGYIVLGSWEANMPVLAFLPSH